MALSFLWLLVFGMAFTVQIISWIVLHYGFQRARRRVPPDLETPPPMTIVVAARDEAAHLPTLLTALTRQTHSPYDIVLVDDASGDGTEAIVRVWQKDHPSLQYIRVNDPQAPRKKHALTLGIDAASNNLLAFTDADCVPPPGWLAALAQHHALDPGDVLLIGYSPFRKRPGLLNRMARYETFVTGFLTAAAVGLGRPYMAVGRNLSYGRTVFERIGGFAHSLASMSGDDDLLVQEVARCRAAAIHHVFDPRTFVPSEAPATWREWVHQKRRHLSAGRFYAQGVKAHLTLFHLTGIVLWMAPLGLGWIGLSLLATKLLLQGMVLRRAAYVFHERDLLLAQPLLELLYAAYNLCLAPLGLARMPRRWS